MLKLKGTKYLLMSALPPIIIKSSNRYSERLHSDGQKPIRDESQYISVTPLSDSNNERKALKGIRHRGLDTRQKPDIDEQQAHKGIV